MAQNLELRDKMDWPNRYGMALFVDGEPRHAVKAETSKVMHIDAATRASCAQQLVEWAKENGFEVRPDTHLEIKPA